MSRRYNEEEMLVCERCGRQYIPSYHHCPYCEAEAKASRSSAGRRVKSPAEVLLTVVLTLAVIAGALFIGFNMITKDEWHIGREHSVTVEDSSGDQVSSGITEQEVVITAGLDKPAETEADESETPSDEEDSDEEDDSDEDSDEEEDYDEDNED